MFEEGLIKPDSLTSNAMKERIDVTEEQVEQCRNELNQIFGENLVKLFFNSNI